MKFPWYGKRKKGSLELLNLHGDRVIEASLVNMPKLPPWKRWRYIRTKIARHTPHSFEASCMSSSQWTSSLNELMPC